MFSWLHRKLKSRHARKIIKKTENTPKVAFERGLEMMMISSIVPSESPPTYCAFKKLFKEALPFIALR